MSSRVIGEADQRELAELYKNAFIRMRTLVAKLAPDLFLKSEGGGHDLGLWADSGVLTPWEYNTIQHILDSHLDSPKKKETSS